MIDALQDFCSSFNLIAFALLLALSSVLLGGRTVMRTRGTI